MSANPLFGRAGHRLIPPGARKPTAGWGASTAVRPNRLRASVFGHQARWRQGKGVVLSLTMDKFLSAIGSFLLEAVKIRRGPRPLALCKFGH